VAILYWDSMDLRCCQPCAIDGHTRVSLNYIWPCAEDMAFTLLAKILVASVNMFDD
jgi:hypothetical protein